MSLQHDWAHVEWSADFLVPDAGGAGDWEEACSSAANEEDAFVFRAAAIAEVRGPARGWGGKRGKGCAPLAAFISV